MKYTLKDKIKFCVKKCLIVLVVIVLVSVFVMFTPLRLVVVGGFLYVTSAIEELTYVPDQKYELKDGVITVSGDGRYKDYIHCTDCCYFEEDDMFHLSHKKCLAPWYEKKAKITSVVVKSEFNYVGHNAFNEYENLKSVKISEGITEIGEFAFANNPALTSVELPNSLTEILNCAFENCTSLESIVIPDKVTDINLRTFGGCTALKDVTLPKNVTFLGQEAFLDCKSLESISIPVSVNSMFGSVFDGCDALSDIYYGGTVEEWKNIEISLFDGTFEEWMTTFGENTVVHCTDGDITNNVQTSNEG